VSDLALSTDDITELRTLTEVLSFADSYEVVRRVEIPDGRGGRTATEEVVEVGMGALATTGLQPDERETAGRLGWSSAYTLELPYDTTAEPKDRIRLNGARMFEIGGILRGGAWGIAARAVAREVG